MVAGRSERVESLSNVMAAIKSDGSFQGSDEELRLKAREVIIQRSVDSAIKAAQEKGTHMCTHTCTCTCTCMLHVHVYMHVLYIVYCHVLVK